ncbi:MAG TPA: hypothetical protein VM869_32075 [Enhygromyxa sp.]|nr:hypothetical protein [Enhygromyxa sp.]
MSRVSLDPKDVYARLKLASDLADLRPERRLDAKLDMSPMGVRRRLQLASELSDLCRALAEAGQRAGNSDKIGQR